MIDTSNWSVTSHVHSGSQFCGKLIWLYEQKWAIRDGYNVTFGIQGAIVGGGVLVVLILHWFGARLRQKGGLLKLREEDC